MFVVIYGLILYLILDIFNILFGIHKNNKIYLLYFFGASLLISVSLKLTLNVGYEVFFVSIAIGLIKMFRKFINMFDDKEDSNKAEVIFSLIFFIIYFIILMLLRKAFTSLSNLIVDITNVTVISFENNTVFMDISIYIFIALLIVYLFELFQKFIDIGVDLTTFEASSLFSKIINFLAVAGLVTLSILAFVTPSEQYLSVSFYNIIYVIASVVIVLFIGITELDDFDNYQWLNLLPTLSTIIVFFGFII